MKTYSNQMVPVIAALFASIAVSASVAPAIAATTTASSSEAPSASTAGTLEMSLLEPHELGHFSIPLAARVAP